MSSNNDKDEENRVLNSNNGGIETIESGVEISRDLSADHPDVTKKELWGWYLFEFASQPYSSAVITTFLPLVLEDLAWRAGTSDYHDPNLPPCADRSQLTADQLANFTCHTAFGGGWISPVSFSLYITAISVGLQVVSFISFGAMADYLKWRKVLLLVFSTLTAISCILYLIVLTPKMYMVAAVLTILGNIAYGTSIVFYNAYLPILADAHPTVRKLKAEIEARLYDSYVSGHAKPAKMFIKDESPDYSMDSTSTNNMEQVPMQNISTSISITDAREEAVHEMQEARDHIANEISTKGLGLGYGGAVGLLCLLAGMMFAIGSDSSYVMQMAIAICGFWQLIITWTTCATWIRARPGPAFPESERKYGPASYFVYSWKKTYYTIRKAAKLRETFLFLISWFFYSDGYSTIASVAILFGKSELNMTSTQLVIIAVVTPLVAIAGNFFFLYVCRKRLQMASKRIVIMLLGLVSLIPVYGILGFATGRDSHFGIKTVAEMYVLAVYFGFLLGALQSFSRVMFSELLPPGMESEFFALYEITDRGSSWLGPLLVAVITDALGNVRYGFIMLLILLLISLPPLLLVDVKKGKKDSRDFHIANS